MNEHLIDTIDEAYRKIQEHEDETSSKFYIQKVRLRDFGNSELNCKKGNSFIHWFDTLPYIHLNLQILECQFGPDRHTAFKAKMKKKKNSDHSQATKSKKLSQCSKKLGCPAKITLKEVITFPDFKISKNSMYNKNKASKHLREITQQKEVTGIKKFILTLPANESEHKMHPIEEESEVQTMDENVCSKIKELVGNAVTDTREIKRNLHQFVVNELCEASELPSQSNRRFFPSSEDICNVVNKTLRKLSYSTNEQQNVQQMVEEHLNKYPGDFFYFRPYHEIGKDNIKKNMLLIYQSAKQKYLLQCYGDNLCLLDSTFKTTKYTLPLFFICVRTNVNYQVVAFFVTQNETTDSIIEAISKLKEENTTWKPRHFMTDFGEQEITAIETVFPDTYVFLCDFHREQTWKRWVKNSSHGVDQAVREYVLKHLRDVANADSVEAFNYAVEVLKNRDFWKTNEGMQNWFEKEWLTSYKRWVWAFRKDEMELPINTNNDVERKNRRVIYAYLSKKIKTPLSSMLKLIITKFIPDSFQSYIELNVNNNTGLANSNEIYDDEGEEEVPMPTSRITTQRENYSNIETEKPVEQARSLSFKGAQVRKMLAEIQTLSYEINDLSEMENLKDMLEPVLKYISIQTVNQKRCTVSQNKEVKLTNKRKRSSHLNKNSENRKILGPPLRKKPNTSVNYKYSSPVSNYNTRDSSKYVVIEGTFDIPTYETVGC